MLNFDGRNLEENGVSFTHPPFVGCASVIVDDDVPMHVIRVYCKLQVLVKKNNKENHKHKLARFGFIYALVITVPHNYIMHSTRIPTAATLRPNILSALPAICLWAQQSTVPTH
jgi:hypothetical protein